MPRQPKSYFRKQLQSWCCSTNGKLHSLGRSKAEAFRKFHQLMAAVEERPDPPESFTLYALSQAYLDWGQPNHWSHRRPQR